MCPMLAVFAVTEISSEIPREGGIRDNPMSVVTLDLVIILRITKD